MRTASRKKSTLAVWIDMASACDKVWTDGLVNKLISINISHKLLHWISGYLKNRQALVKTNGIRNKSAKQNSTRSSLPNFIFHVFKIAIQKQISKRVYPLTSYADDPTIKWLIPNGTEAIATRVVLQFGKP